MNLKFQLLIEYIQEESFKNSNISDIKTSLLKIIKSVFSIEHTPHDLKKTHKSLLKNIIYIVLNHTPILIDPDNRQFIGVMNLDLVDEKIKNMIFSNGLIKKIEKEEECKLLVIDKGKWKTDHYKSITNVWNNKWSEYFKITKDVQNSFTWNQFLLKGSKKPGVIGVNWGKKEKGISDSYYTQINNEIAYKIQLPSIDNTDMRINLLALDINNAPKIDDQIIMPNLYKRFEAFGPVNNESLLGLNWMVFHLFRSYAFWGGSAFISIPFRFDKDAPNSTAVLSLCTTDPLEENDIQKWQLITDKIFNPLLSAENIEKEKQDAIKIKKSAKKAAEAAIMARNMAHNLGSSVLTKLSSKEQIMSFADKKDQKYNYLAKQVGLANAYVGARMDFVADIVTSLPSAVIKMKLYSDVIRLLTNGASKPELILNFISGNEKIKMGDLKFYAFNSSNCLESNTTLENKNDVIFGSPNALLGAQSLYTIIENILRNSSKHATLPKNEDLEISILINENNHDNKEEYIQIRVFDNCGNCNNSLLQKMNEQIKRDIITPTGDITTGGWGIFEMKACALYLRAKSGVDINENETPPYIQAISVDSIGKASINGSGNLCYQFYLLKPKEVAVITKSKVKITPKTIQQFKKYGIEFFVHDQKANNIRELMKFKILVFEPKINLKWYDDNSEKLPVLRGTMEENIDDMLKDNIDPMAFYNEIIGITTDNLFRYMDEIPKIIICEDKWKDVDGVVSLSQYNKTDTKHKFIIFDSHANNINKYLENSDDMSSNVMYYQSYKSQDTTAFLLRFPPSDDVMKNILKFELLMVGLTNVVILDERIQAIHKKEDYDQKLLLKRLNIIIPEECDNFNLNTLLHENNPEIKDIINKKLEQENSTRKNHFLVIHLGILNSMFPIKSFKYPTNIEAMKKWIEGVKQHIPFVIVTSGRAPSKKELPSNVRLIHYSNIQKNCLIQKNKINLCHLLYYSRRPI